MNIPHEHSRVVAQPTGPSLSMRLTGALLSSRARRREGRPVDLAADRRANDRVTAWLRVPRGVTLTEEMIAGVPVIRLSSGNAKRGTVLYLHGGAYALGSARQVLAAAAACVDGGPDMVSVEYRLAPEHPFPAAVDDAMAVYRAVVESVGADRLMVAGDSAGGGLLLLLLQRAHREGVAMPAAAVPGFPAADLSLSGRSSTANIGKDMLVRSELDQEALWFADGRDLRDPAVSPVFGSFEGFPRTLIPVGTHDLLLDDARRVAAAMAAQGVDVTLEEYPGAIHGFTASPLPEGRRSRQRFRALIDTTLPAIPRSGSRDLAPDRDGHTSRDASALPPGRLRFAVIGRALRLIDTLPTPIRERLLDGAVGGVSSSLPPFPDILRLIEAAGGVPSGLRWQERLIADRPDLRGVRTRDIDNTDSGLRARLYLPPTDAAAAAAIVWVHGGGFVMGSLDQKEAHWPAIELAAAGIPVLSVDYRMCVKGVHYPAPQDDVLTAWRWAVEHADELLVEPGQLHLGGGSAGGCLVAGATLRLRDAGEHLPASLFLAYPVLQGDLPVATPAAAAELASLPVASDQWVRDMFTNWAGPAPWGLASVSPGLADPAGLPPTYVLSCGADSLRRASEPYADRLRDAGVPMWHDLLAGSEHAPLDRPGTPDGQRAVQRLRTWLTTGVAGMGS